MRYQVGQMVPFDYPRKLVGDILGHPEWYILRTVPQKEFAAQVWLQQFGIVAWLPTEPRWRKVPTGRRNKVMYQHRIAPGYLFCHFHRCPNWDVIRDKGHGKISGVVSKGEWPLVIPDAAIARMRMVPEQIEIQRKRAMEARIIRPGDKAEITKGPLSGWVVDISRVHAGIAHFVVPLLGEAEATMPVDDLERKAP